MIVSPSLLSANFLNLDKEIEMLNRSEADWIHLDIMDGKFVPNITFGFPVIKQIKSVAKKPLDVHLMIEEPERYVEEFKNAGADYLVVHYEAVTHLHRCLQSIKENGMKAGVSVNPHTPVSLLKSILPYTDMILIMTVNPGYGGQKFIDEGYNKISELKEMSNKLNPELIIEVDGGVSLENAAKLKHNGCNALVAGSSVFKSKNPQDIISSLKKT